MRAWLLLALLAPGCLGHSLVRATGTCLIKREVPLELYAAHGGRLVLRNVGNSLIELERLEREPIRLEPGQELLINEGCTARVASTAPFASNEDARLYYDLRSDEYCPGVGVYEWK